MTSFTYNSDVSLSLILANGTQNYSTLKFSRLRHTVLIIEGDGISTFTVYRELQIPYSVPVCVTGILWLVKFNGFILQPMAKTNYIFPVHGKPNRIINSKFS